MSRLNCFEAELQGINFKFTQGIKADEIMNGKLYLNGLGEMFFEGARLVNGVIDEIFADDKEVWVGEKGGAFYIYQAGITLSNNFIEPISEEPRYSRTKYVRLSCDREDEVILLGEGRVLFRLFAGGKQTVLLEMGKEAVVTVTRSNGSTAIFESTETGFKIV